MAMPALAPAHSTWDSPTRSLALILSRAGAEHGHACSRTRPFYAGFSHTQPCVDPVTGRGAEHGHACSRTRPFYVGYSPRSSDR